MNNNEFNGKIMKINSIDLKSNDSLYNFNKNRLKFLCHTCIC